MTIHVEETEDSSRMLAAGYEANQNSIDLEFFYWDDTYADLDPVNVLAAVAAVVAAAPYGDPLYNLRLQTINHRPLSKFAGTANVHYGVFEPPKVTEGPEYKLRMGFSISSATENIKSSLGTIQHPRSGLVTTPPDFNNAIHVVNQSGRSVPQGTSRNVTQLSWRVTAFINPAEWGPTQWININDLCNTWNVNAWKGWPEETLLFTHPECAEYEVGSGQIIPVTFHFMVRRPEVVTKSAYLTFTKHPWSFLWDYVTPIKEVGSSAQGLQIDCVYEEQLYASSDFTLLGLGS